jgi:uncharacterized delta-60 repeat protein
VSGLFIQADDQIVMYGVFTSFNGAPCNSIVRLNNVGQVDPTFSTASFQEYGDVGDIAAVAQQSDTKLIVAGYFHSLGGASANNVVRLQATGARDSSFGGEGAGPFGYHISAVAVRPSDGKIFLGGYFSTYDGAARGNIAWANTDGSADSTFVGLTGATEYGPQIFALASQSDDKIIAGGLFSSFNGTSHYNLVRLNADGTSDASFNANVSTERSVRAVLVQPDGKILIAGNFVAVNGVARGRVARLNSDGTLDSTFDPGSGADFTIFALAQDSDGNVYVGGAFTTFNGVSRGGIAKLSASGALDPTFDSSGGDVNQQVFAMATPDGAGGIVIGGTFASFNGTTARRIARSRPAISVPDVGSRNGEW